MSKCIVFNGLQALDFQEVRTNAVRIPEVSRQIFGAQKIWDETRSGEFNLYNYVISDNKLFLSNIRFKGLAVSVVQLGLYERFLKSEGRPEFLIGPDNGSTPLGVAAGKQSFDQLVAECRAVMTEKPVPHLHVAEVPQLSGLALTEYRTYQRQPDGNYEAFGEPSMDPHTLVARLVTDESLKTIVNVGPGSTLIHRGQEPYSMSDLQILESIDLDPMLSWFWPMVQRPGEQAVAGL